MSSDNNSTSITTVNQPLDSNNRPRKMGLIYRFFCWCSGANIEVLEQYPTEYNKYFGTGTLICMTGLFAFIAATYALSTIFESGSNFSFYAGGIWGLFIFLLDRFLVGSMSKSNSKWQEIRIATPRFFLAILIALTIARPLELRIFKSEIDVQLKENRDQKLLTIDSIFESKKNTLDIRFKEKKASGDEENSLLIEKDTINNRMAKAKNGVENLRLIWNAEVIGSKEYGGSGKKNIGPIAKEKKGHYLDATKAYEGQSKIWISRLTEINNQLKRMGSNKVKLQSELNLDYEKQLNNLNTQKDTAIADANKVVYSILNQNIALNQMMDEKEGVPTIVLVITLLFIVFECAPIIAKLSISKGPYDDAIEDIEHDLRNQSRERRFLSKQENIINKNMIIDMAKSQKEIIKESLRNWRDDEMDRVEREREKRKENEFI